jgi:hypothetical protein
MSKHIQIAMLTIVLLSTCASLAVGRFHSHSLGLSIGVPALVISGWAFFGHLITLDEDAPGSFFNPVSASSSHIWRSSLVELLAKAALLVVVCALVFAGQ